MREPFRCVRCGAVSGAATACGHCGGRAFELAKPTLSRPPAEPVPAPPVSLQERRERRARRRSAQHPD